MWQILLEIDQIMLINSGKHQSEKNQSFCSRIRFFVLLNMLYFVAVIMDKNICVCVRILGDF